MKGMMKMKFKAISNSLTLAVLATFTSLYADRGFQDTSDFEFRGAYRTSSSDSWNFLNGYSIPAEATEIRVTCSCVNAEITSTTIPSSVVYTWEQYDGKDENGNSIYHVESRTLPVTGVSCYGCSSLQSVSIPSSVTSIGDWGFKGCSSLQSVSIPSSVTSICDWGFEDCSSLKNVTIPNSVTNLGSSAFSQCGSLETAVIGNNVKSIRANTFYQCTSLTNVTIGSSVGSIENNAFYQCGALTEVTIPAGVTNIALTAFKSCDGLQQFIVDPANPVYASYDGALYTKDLKTLISYPGGRTDVKLPSGAVETKEDAFTGCGKLWAEWYRTFQKTRYDLSNSMEDRAIASVTVSGDTTLDNFVLKDGKVYDTVLYINNTAGHAVKLTLPQGNTYRTFKGAKPLTIPANTQSILTITRIAGGNSTENVFLVSREELVAVE